MEDSVEQMLINIGNDSFSEEDSDSESSDNEEQGRGSNVSDLVALQIIAASTFFSGTWKNSKIVDVFGTLDRIYRDIQCKNRQVKTQIKVTVVSIVITLLFIIKFGQIMMDDAQVLSVMKHATFLLLECTHLTFLFHFTHVTQSITMGFKMVTDKMRHQIICNIIEHTVTERSLADVAIFHTTRTTVSKIKKMKSLMNTYWMLCDAVHQANDFYCDQLMAVMFSLFVHVTIKSYFFFLHVRSSEVFALTIDAVWVMVHICYGILVVNSSTEVTNSAEETSLMICKLISKDMNQSFRNELKGFLRQSPHHNARFSARGFFKIHNETLISMAGAATTNLVVLIQFQAEK
ncbi:putative gustatory receptor 2a [Homalodisca vitripennis]|uniref:putative gustatory receptor 2a n=1 Tax=Homalodisca vitripennis TaxID=197043 RepID=UPI001EEABC5D|nr:putative gustatory receptor 2a [Homalodisca vitripennis]